MSNSKDIPASTPEGDDFNSEIKDEFDLDNLDVEAMFRDANPTLDSFQDNFSVEKEGNAAADELTKSERAEVAEKLSSLKRLAPIEIAQQLLGRGYRGQEYARRGGSVLAYRHMQRLRRDFVENVPKDELPPRGNYLFLGTTGSGKTYLTEMLFRDILKVPTVVADVTRCSENGYIGDDVQMLLSELYEAADQSRGWASCGVAFLDEFDKLAASRSSARFAGEGSTKDVSGFGVQRSLLILLSGQSSPFPTDFGFSGQGQRVIMPLRNLMFIACGAFSGLKEISEMNEASARIGFDAKASPERDDALISRIGTELLENTKAFSNYGILPELLGRFSRLVPFQPLGEEVMSQILEDILIDNYTCEFKSEGVELIIGEDVIEHVVKGAKSRETGARGLRAWLVPHLEEAAFKTFGHDSDGRVLFKVVKGEVVAEIDAVA